MSIEIVDISGCKRNLVVELPPEALEEEIHKLAQKYTKQARVPGFRPGKVPLGIIKQRFANELRSDATQDLISRYWRTAVQERQLHPLAEPVLEHMDAAPGSPIKFTVSFEELPPIEIKDYIGIPYILSDPSMGEADVDKALEEMREQHAQFVPVEQGEIADGHMVILTIDGEFDGGGKPLHEEDAALLVGNPRTNETFSQNLLGAKLGDQRSFDVSYPSDYHRKQFAGKQVHYRVLIKDIKEKQLPELNDEFARDLCGQENLTSLRAKLKEDLITKAKQNAEKKAKEAVLDYLVQRHSFDVPECLVQGELHDHSRRISTSLARQGIDVSKTSIDWKKIYEEERPHAVLAVRRSLVLDAIARQEMLEANDAELEEEFRQLGEGSGKSAAALRAQFEKDKRIQGFKDHLRQKKALDFIFRNASISKG